MLHLTPESQALIRSHIVQRRQISTRLQNILNGTLSDFVENALGILDRQANYSATEDRGRFPLCKSIIAENRNLEARLRDLGLKFVSGQDLPATVAAAAISYLKLGVGSELGMMLNPRTYWVHNTRSIWFQHLVFNGWDVLRSNQYLRYLGEHYDACNTPEYYNLVGASLNSLRNDVYYQGLKLFQAVDYLEADAIVDRLYEDYGAD
jgi:hypothetical protein